MQDKILKTIQSANKPEVFKSVVDYVSVWALCGFINQPNLVLEVLWSLGYYSYRDRWLNEEGFTVMWSIAGKTPANIPFEVKSLVEIERENWFNLFDGHIWQMNIDLAQRTDAIEISTITDQLLSNKGVKLAYDAYFTRKSNKNIELQTAFNLLEKYFNKNDLVGYQYFISVTRLLVLAAHLELENELDKYFRLWFAGYQNYPSNYVLPYLMRDEPTARQLVKGTLASYFKLMDEACNISALEISNGLKERNKQGQTLTMGDQSWQNLLKKISKCAIERNEVDIERSVIKSGWLGYNPATLVDIDAAEKRLNISLPNEYKGFLLASNGFRSCSFTSPALLPVSEIGWLRVLMPELVSIYEKEMGGMDHQYAATLKRALLIGGLQDEQQLLLIAPDKQEDEWECWFFANWMPVEEKFENFRYYMEDVLINFEEDESV